MVYSGDTDGEIPSIGTVRWIKNLVNSNGLAVEIPQKAWTLPYQVYNKSQVAGYYTVYQGLTFVQHKGVGHFVPQWQKAGAWKMMAYFLNNTFLN